MPSKQTSVPPWHMGRTALRKLGQKKYRQQTGLYLLEGGAAVKDAVSAGADIHGVVYAAKGSGQNKGSETQAKIRQADRETLTELRRRKVPLKEVDHDILKSMSGLSTPPFIIAVLLKPPVSSPVFPLPHGLILALDRVNDPGNVGSILRSAAFFGLREVWLGEGTAELYNPKTLRAAMAAHLYLKVCPSVNLEDSVREAKGYKAEIFAAVTEDGEPPGFLSDTQKSYILLLGSEAHGLNPGLIRLADKLLSIPCAGSMDSLNVTMAGTVLIDRLLRK